MEVVINPGFLSGVYSEEYVNFLSKIFAHIAPRHGDHTFVFLCEKEYAHLFETGKNVKVHIIKRSVSGFFLRKYWYDVRVPVILRKYRADLFITTNGFCSLTTNVPQCMIIPDLAFLHFPSFFTRTQLLFYKRYTRKFINKATTIITHSAFSKNDIITNYGAADDKIDIVYNGVDDIFGPGPEDTVEEIKKKYTDGKDFFLYTGSVYSSSNLINLLKAFSLFKKRQQSSLKLLVCAKAGTGSRSFIQSLLTYKYRRDVVYLENPDEQLAAAVTASAYALVYPAYFDGFSAPVMQALQCRVPVITSGHSPMQEIAGEAALYADPGDFKAIAEQLMRLYKDENRRNELIKAGSSLAGRYKWDKSAESLWHTIGKTVLKRL